MKAVMISIQPKWVEKIAKGEKTIEVRKTRPKIETPFKCYIYCTKDKYQHIYDLRPFTNGEISLSLTQHNKTSLVPQNYWNGKVIGEFVCDDVIQWNYKRFITMTGTNDTYFPFRDDLKATCLSYEEFANYGKGKTLYGWHISNLKIYDKPKELSEFKTVKLTERQIGFNRYETKSIERPPQSWCYVEDLL